jgi:hypothetical protein
MSQTPTTHTTLGTSKISNTDAEQFSILVSYPTYDTLNKPLQARCAKTGQRGRHSDLP